MAAALPSTVLAGDRLSGDDFTAMLAILAAQAVSWTPYTPGWIASAGTPAIGNGQLVGRYILVGKTAHIQITLTAGSTTTYGTVGASWGFVLPSGWIAASDAVFPYQMSDIGVQDYAGVGYIQNGAVFFGFIKPAGSGGLVNNSPFTFGSGDVFRMSATLEVN